MALPILNLKQNKRWLKRHKNSNTKICPDCGKEEIPMTNWEGKKTCSSCYFKSL